MESTAPFWQCPGVEWESLPLVKYESCEEYDRLCDDLIKEYCAAVKGALFSQIKDDTFSLISRYGLPFDVIREWRKKGKGMFLKLTKGEGEEWCDLTNATLLCVLDTATRLYTCGRVTFPAEGVEVAIQSVNEILSCEIQRFVRICHMSPLGEYVLPHVNFVYCTNSPGGTYCMPVWKFQEAMTAFCMGRHARLGNGSVVNCLTEELVRMVFAWEVF